MPVKGILLFQTHFYSFIYLFFFFAPVASFTLSPTKLLIGTYDGKIFLCDTEKLLNNESTVQTFSSQPVKELQGHLFAVYSLLCVRGHISTDAPLHSSPCSSENQMSPFHKSFLSVLDLEKVTKNWQRFFKGSVAKEGTYINTGYCELYMYL